MADLIQQLHAADFSADRPIRHTLRRKLLKHLDTQPSPPIRNGIPRVINHQVTRLAIVLGILVVIVWNVPPLRSFAQDVIRTIGGISITNEPTWAEQQLDMIAHGTPTPTPVPLDDHGPAIYFRVRSLDETSELAGFQALAPGYVPAGYQLAVQDVITGESGTQVTIYYHYWAADGSIAPEDGDFLVILEMQWSENAEQSDLKVGSATVIDVTVNGQPGIWIEGMVTGWWTAQELIPMPTNMLLWEQQGLTFIIQTHWLPLDEVLLIAESLSAHPEEITAHYQATAEAAAAQFSSQVAYPVYFPAKVPAGYTLESREVVFDQALTIVHMRYQQRNNNNQLDIVQIPLEHPSAAHLWDLCNQEQIQNVLLSGGADGFWISSLPDPAALDLPPTLGLTQQGALIWQMDGYLFMIQNDTLPLNTLLKTGGSMAPQ